jgi:aminoglycoside phosphotransferase (APT) family kinase protein
LGALGRSLARLHQLQLRPPDDAIAAGLLLAERATALATALRQLPLPAGLYEQLTTALAHPAWHCPTPRLVHGDAGLHNLLWAAPRLTLLDWELAGWGDPRVDLAWLAWTLRFRGLPPRCWQAVLAGYGPRAATLVADEATLRALALGQVSGLLARAAGRPHWDEWLRRARWSVELGPLF